VSYRDLEETASIRRAVIDHATYAKMVNKVVPLIDKQVRKRKKPAIDRGE